MKAQAKLLVPVHESLVIIAYASNEGSDEPAHSCSITTAFAARTEKGDVADLTPELSGPIVVKD